MPSDCPEEPDSALFPDCISTPSHLHKTGLPYSTVKLPIKNNRLKKKINKNKKNKNKNKNKNNRLKLSYTVPYILEYAQDSKAIESCMWFPRPTDLFFKAST